MARDEEGSHCASSVAVLVVRTGTLIFKDAMKFPNTLQRLRSSVSDGVSFPKHPLTLSGGSGGDWIVDRRRIGEKTVLGNKQEENDEEGESKEEPPAFRGAEAWQVRRCRQWPSVTFTV